MKFPPMVFVLGSMINQNRIVIQIVDIRQNCIHFVTIEIHRWLLSKQWWLLFTNAIILPIDCSAL